MNPNVFKISQPLVVLKTLLIMVLVFDCVRFGNAAEDGCEDSQRVKSAKFHHEISKGFLATKSRRVVIKPSPHNLFTITLNDGHAFLLFDPSTDMFICWNKPNQRSKNPKVVVRRNPRNLKYCKFEELPVGSAYTKYVSPKNKNQVIQFNKSRHQQVGLMKNSGRGRDPPFGTFLRFPGDNCKASYTEFCGKMNATHNHQHKRKLARPLLELCNITGFHSHSEKSFKKTLSSTRY